MIKKRFNKTVVVFILLTGIMHVASAYYISGYVTDSSTGLPISNVNVTANTSLSTATNDTGFYNFTDLSNGTYIVNASLAGYDTNSTNVTINGSDATDANISLSPLPAPTYVISGYVSDNYGSGLGGTLVQNGSNQNTTLASGYYLVPGLSNGTYNFSYSRFGFNTGYSEVTINGADNISANITLYDTTPPASVSNINTTTGNFYINNTWVNPADTDFNYTWFRYSNGTTLQNVSTPINYLNLTWQPHYMQNISAQTVDNYSNINQTMSWFNATIPNNAPVQAAIGNQTVYEGQWLNFTVSAIDADNDTITYGTNATKGTFNTTTGNFSWIPNYGDAGLYFWNFNSSDGYGGIENENIAVTVINVPLSVTNSSPAGDPATTVGVPQTFTIALNRTANITWYINDSLVQSNSSVASANYTNSTAGIGTYNVTATANDGYDSAGRTWNWTVAPQPVYAPEITSWGNSKTNDTNLTLAVNAGESVNFNATANQTITTWNWYQDGVNQNNNYDNFTTSWTIAGTKTIQVNATNTNGTSSTVTWNITVQALPAIYIPPSPVSISSTTGNFWVNTTWQAGAGNVTDSYNVSINGAWTNGTTNTSVNSSLSAHSWQNITVYAYNTSGGGSLSISPATETTQIPNNPPIQSSIGNKSVAERQWLNFTVNATDADNDTITYGTNATKGIFDIATGNFSLLTTYSDAGTYVWYFNSSDGYGGIASETITVTVNNTPLSITSFSPPTDPTTVQGAVQDFNITLDRAANVTWYMNGTPVQIDTSTTSASYTNSTAAAGTWNVTAGATDGIDAVSRTWNWTVSQQPTYNVSGYVFDNYGSGLGDVLVKNESGQNTTDASGHYLITGLLNGTYNFSYSKAGFNTGYLGVTISGADNTSVNTTIYDTTPPASVSNPNTTTGNFYINNTWVNPADTDFNYTWFRYSNGTTLQNISTPINYLNLTWSPHYMQNISAQTVDNYSNINQTIVWFNTTIPNNAPFQYAIGNKVINENENLQFNVTATDADNDTITYGTNATKGTFNTTTGNFSWTPGYGDAGVYFWNFNSSDGFGGVASETITVTVGNVPLSITSSSPAGDPTTTVGTAQTFGMALNRTADVIWYINGSAVQTNSSAISADYTNSTAGVGEYNITAIANDSYNSVLRTWNWTVIAQPTYNVSGYASDNYGSGLGGVLVQNGSSQNTTLASGYYLITGLPKGTYNFSFSKAGFDTGYLEVAINGADNTSTNISLAPLPVPTYAISGYITNVSNGLPLDNATVMTNTSLSTTTNASGFYNFTGLSNGSYILSSNLTGYGTNSTNVTINGSDVTNANISLSPLSAPTYVLSGYVMNSSTGLPISNVNMTTNTSLSTTTNSSGFYNFTGLSNGTYIVNASLTGYNTNSTNVTINGSNITNANISLSPLAPVYVTSSSAYMISGYVTNASDGSPLSNVNMTTNTSQSMATNASGFYNFTGLSNGTYIVNASLAGYDINSTNVTINGSDITNANISLSPVPEPSYMIMGYITNASSGLPLDNVTVITNTSLSTATNASGFYNFTGLSNGTYIINASLAGYDTNFTNVTINGSDAINANISLSVSSGGGGSSGIGAGTGPGIGGGIGAGAGISYNISGYVLNSYTLDGLGGADVTLNTTVNTSMQNTSNSTGFYIFTGLTNGSYSIKASLSGYPDNFTNITISGADITNANIYLTLPSTQCTDCHYSFSYMNSSGRPDLYVNQTQVNESVHAALDCRDCHTNTTVHPPPKSGWKWCEDCHADQQNPPTNKSRHNIVANPWNNLYNGISAVNITSCVTCHDPVLYNNSINTYGRESGIDCDYCHTFPDNVID